MDVALNWVLDQPWAILPAMLETICRVAARENDDVRAVAARLGRPLQNTQRAEAHGEVAVIPVRGPIARYGNLFTEVSGATSTDVLARDIRAALDDPAIRALVLDIDSPGGQVAGIADLAQLIRLGKQEKPIVAFAGDYAASGAYWLAAASSRVVASKTAKLGSIGVLIQPRPEPDRPGQLPPVISSGAPHKRTDPRSESGHARLQAMADDLEDAFVGDVAADRGVTPDRVRADFGRGDVLIGPRAVAAGMADATGTLESCIADLQAGRLPGRHGKVAPPTPKVQTTMNVWEKIGRAIAGGAAADSIAADEDRVAVTAAAPGRIAPCVTYAGKDELEVVHADTPHPKVAELERRLEALQTQNRAAALARIQDRAVAFMQRRDVAARVTARELPLLGMLYQAVASADLDHETTATWTARDGDKDVARTGPLAALLEESVLARPPHRLFEERAVSAAHPLPAGLQVLAAADDPDAAAKAEADYDLKTADAYLARVQPARR